MHWLQCEVRRTVLVGRRHDASVSRLLAPARRPRLVQRAHAVARSSAHHTHDRSVAGRVPCCLPPPPRRADQGGTSRQRHDQRLPGQPRGMNNYVSGTV